MHDARIHIPETLCIRDPHQICLFQFLSGLHQLGLNLDFVHRDELPLGLQLFFYDTDVIQVGFPGFMQNKFAFDVFADEHHFSIDFLARML